jgi:hypothetical protein
MPMLYSSSPTKVSLSAFLDEHNLRSANILSPPSSPSLGSIKKDLAEKKRRYAELKAQLETLAYEIHEQECTFSELTDTQHSQAMLSVNAFDRVSSSHR